MYANAQCSCLYSVIFAVLYLSRDPGAVEFRRLTESNFRGVEVVDRPVKPPSNFFRAAAAAFNVQFFDALTKMTEFLVFNSFNIKNAVNDQNHQCSGITVLFTFTCFM